MNLIKGVVLALPLLLTGQFTVPQRTGAIAAGGLNPCLISAWPMNEGSGVTLHDTSTGGTNTATVNNIANITWGAHAGFPGNSIKWSGPATATATSTTLTNFTGTTPFSVSVWSNPSTASIETYITNATSNTTPGWMLLHHLIAAGQDFIDFRIVNTAPTNSIEVHGTTNYDVSGGLAFIVATYDGSQTAAGVKLYLNGVLDTPNVINNSLSASAATGNAPTFNTFGGGTFGSLQITGYVEVYNCVVTSGFVASSFAAGPGIY